MTVTLCLHSFGVLLISVWECGLHYGSKYVFVFSCGDGLELRTKLIIRLLIKKFMYSRNSPHEEILVPSGICFRNEKDPRSISCGLPNMELLWSFSAKQVEASLILRAQIGELTKRNNLYAGVYTVAARVLKGKDFVERNIQKRVEISTPYF